MKLIIAGGRNFADYKLLTAAIDKHFPVVSEVVCGMARGADMLGYKYAVDHAIPTKNFPALWDVYGKSAGYKRNSQMANYADSCICFWDGQSRGTMHMINLAKEHQLELVVIRY